MTLVSAGSFWGGGCDQSTTPMIEITATMIPIKKIDPMISDTAA
jgi:hypothetical protein